MMPGIDTETERLLLNPTLSLRVLMYQRPLLNKVQTINDNTKQYKNML